MISEAKNKEYYDDFSSWYEKERHHGYHAMLDDLELDVLRPLAKGKSVLEVGAGTGLIMRGLAKEARRLVGLDISSGMLGLAKKRGFDVVQGSATELPFKDGEFELAYSLKVLAHIRDIERALAEMSRVLKPGGYLIAEFYNALSLRYLAKRLNGPGRISEERTEKDVFTRWDTPAKIESYLPSDVKRKEWRGVRIVTPAALAFKIPGAKTALPVIEKSLLSSKFARFGGFLIAVCQKK